MGSVEKKEGSKIEMLSVQIFQRCPGVSRFESVLMSNFLFIFQDHQQTQFVFGPAILCP